MENEILPDHEYILVNSHHEVIDTLTIVRGNPRPVETARLYWEKTRKDFAAMGEPAYIYCKIGGQN